MITLIMLIISAVLILIGLLADAAILIGIVGFIISLPFVLIGKVFRSIKS